MRRTLILTLALLTVTGCSTTLAATLSTPKAVPKSAWPESTGTHVPPQSTIVDKPEPTGSPPGASTAVPTAAAGAAAAPTISSPVGWKTFTSENLHVAVDYPPDWSVSEQATGAIFTSPRGAMIGLALIETGDLSPEDFAGEIQMPNTRCSSTTNPYGVTARICFDTISFSYVANLVVKSAAGSTRLLSLAIHGRGDLQVFNAMMASVRPSP